MSIISAAFLGFIQGITEFIPVSSSAHLCVLFNLFGVTASGFNVKAFSVFLHFGTIIAALIMYWKDFGEIVFQLLEFGAAASSREAGGRRAFPHVRLFVMMIFAILPLFLLIPLNSTITKLFDMNGFIGIMMILSGTAVFISDNMLEGSKTERNMTISDAVIIGLCQTVSAIPGISRTGIVYTAGVAVGLKREFAVRFAVLLSVPVMFGANIFRMIDAAQLPLSWGDVPVCLVGMAAAIGGGILSLRLLTSLVKRGTFKGIGYYCWVAGVLAIILTMIF